MITAALTLGTSSAVAGTPDALAADQACRSVHLGFPGRAASAFTNEVTILQSSPGTYFMVCGWDQGYFGLQELADGRKLLLFSVWDSEQDDPANVEEASRVKLIFKDQAVRVGRFGGEGTGGQAFFDYPWKVGQTYRLLVTARPDGQRTEYAGFIFLPEAKSWKHLVTFSTLTGGKSLGGYYAFIEDFLRNGVSATQVRKARFGGGWLLDLRGPWTAITTARFTADDNPATNIDAGRAGDRFFLATGGNTQNRTTQLNATIRRSAQPPSRFPGVLTLLFIRPGTR